VVVEPVVDAIFIHVSDMARAVAWYASLLGLPQGKLSHEGLIADVPVRGDTKIILDGHAHANGVPIDRTGPRLMFPTGDLDAALVHARQLSAKVSDPEDIGSAIVFYLEDPDGNLMCIIWRKPS
jgi:catechol-2,3-dioxygenase